MGGRFAVIKVLQDKQSQLEKIINLSRIEKELFSLQKCYANSYSDYCHELEKISNVCKNDNNLRCIFPEKKILIKESEQQYEILKYESFNYFKGSFTEALDF
jgi:hypothetical protein